MQPYGEEHLCSSDLDCPHRNYYCAEDPTGGGDKYWIQYCRRQLEEGRKCNADRECQADMLCNALEIPSPRCRKLFSLPLGHLAKDPRLCVSAWTNNLNVCAFPAKSKRVGMSCQSDDDCITTDPTGKTGQCFCKQWWNTGNSKYCLPVTGDYKHHSQSLRDWTWFEMTKCGKTWSEAECLEEFGKDATDLLYNYRCETQELSRGPYLPPSSCGIGTGDGRFVDYCKIVNSVEAPVEESAWTDGWWSSDAQPQLRSGLRIHALMLLLVSFTVLIAGVGGA